MDVNKYRNFRLIIISVILMFSSKPIATADEDIDDLLALFDRPLEPLPISNLTTTPVPPFPAAAPVPMGPGIPASGSGMSGGVAGLPGAGGGSGGIGDGPQYIELPEGNERPFVLPDDDYYTFDKREEFSVFIPKHLKIASKLISRFLDAKDEKEFALEAYQLRDLINPYLFTYAFSVALMHRNDTLTSRIPSQVQSFPHKYLDKQVFLPAREQLATISPEARTPIELERTASDSDDEHRLSYWREDIALNLHHWHWHLAYPNTGHKQVINKDRRGELFYYMHQQIIARYNFERLSNNLKLVERLSNWNAPIKEAYFPRLDNVIAKEIYPSRPKNMIFDDIRIQSQDIEMDVGDMVRYRDRIFRAIDLGYAEGEDGDKVYLDEETGINTLGNILESSDLSPNPRYYGNLHGAGHLMIAYIHDPKEHHLQSMAVMGDTATAMRDPVFYRWHAYVDDIFRQYKDTLTPYTYKELGFPRVQIAYVQVQTEGEGVPINTFRTYWSKSEVDMINGLDFTSKKGSVFVRYTHLNHRPFSYDIRVINFADEVKEGICRIFLGPAIDDSRKPWTRFIDQRSMFVEMDKFKVTLKKGVNDITRESVESTVTIPFEETFYDFKNKEHREKNKYAYSGCGWPHHLLVPKGSSHGFPTQLFVMISSVEEDKVHNSRNSHTEGYCGVRGGKFPHKRAMGFPFDRKPAPGVKSLYDFLTRNMYVLESQIYHEESFGTFY